MKYGVITVCLNSEETIARTIHSVLGQTLLPSEYIFVDGGSKDNTLAIINNGIHSSQQQNQNINFVVLHQTEKGGITQAWNMGLAKITADIVFILNSDDWYEPQCASFVLSCFDKHPEIDIVLGSGRYLSNDSSEKEIICHTRPFLIFPFAMPVIHPACFVRKTLYDTIGNFDENYRVSADYDFLYRCYKSKINFQKHNKVLVNVLIGGFAENNKDIARKEVYEIGRRYYFHPFLPKMAFLLRSILHR